MRAFSSRYAGTALSTYSFRHVPRDFEFFSANIDFDCCIKADCDNDGVD